MSIHGSRFFITGGAGLIATSLIARLADRNRIVIYDNFQRDTISSTPYARHPHVRIVRGDVLDERKVLRCMKGADVVVHAAAIAGVDTVLRIPVRTMRVNMIGTAHVLEAARLCRVPNRVVTFSTSEVFGSNTFKATEDSETVAGSVGEARWTYSVSKLASEHLTMAYHREYGLPTVTVRPFNVYGPGQTGEGALQVFVRRALRGEDLLVRGDGTQIRAWCYVGDFVDCLLRCLESPRAVGESFNIGNARAVQTTYGLAHIVREVLGSRSRILFRPALSAEVELRIPSVEKARRVLKFEAQVDLEEGIRKTAEWVRGRS